jgi:acetyltransferase-like isoleucine patch superfamily enzyme
MMNNNSFYSEDELKTLGLKSYGTNVLISKKTSIYGAENISIGNNVRIDDFAILSGCITIGSFVHIAAGVYLFAGDIGIELYDFSAVSHHSCLYAISDDYTGEGMTNPTIPDEFRNIQVGKIIIEKHGLVGASCIILPNVIISEGCSVGALSLVTKKTDPWKVYFGSPAKAIKNRKKNLLDLERRILSGD